uniref:Uncharacterized protein n=1 Tax=Anguilla anguilla TaxID=7936 RepID=A0A0E9TNH2_ANGAN
MEEDGQQAFLLPTTTLAFHKHCQHWQKNFRDMHA